MLSWEFPSTCSPFAPQTVQWHSLQREVNQVLAQLQTKHRALDALEHRGSGDAGNVQARQREFGTFLRALGLLEERAQRLAEMARGMAKTGHMEAKGCERVAKQVNGQIIVFFNTIRINRPGGTFAGRVKSAHGRGEEQSE